MALGQLAVFGNDAELLLARKRFFAHLVPALVELPLVFVGPLLGHVMRRVCGARRVVDEEWLVWRQRLLLPYPIDGVVC